MTMIYQVTYEHEDTRDQSFWSTKAAAQAEVDRIIEVLSSIYDIDVKEWVMMGCEGAETYHCDGVQERIALDSWELDATPIDLLGE